MHSALRATVLALLASCGLVTCTPGQESAYARQVQPFLKQHCIACHGPDRQKGGVRFDGPAPDLSDAKSAAKWLAVKRMVSEGQMPPEGSKQPKADDVIALLAWIDDALARAASIDQHIAEAVGGKTRWPSMVVGADGGRMTCSFNRLGELVLADFDLKNIFDELVGADPRGRLGSRASILDLVSEQATELRTFSERMGVEAKGFGESRRTLDELLS